MQDGSTLLLCILATRTLSIFGARVAVKGATDETEWGALAAEEMEEAKTFYCGTKEYHYQIKLPNGSPVSVLFDSDTLKLTIAAEQLWATALANGPATSSVNWTLVGPDDTELPSNATMSVDLFHDVKYIRRSNGEDSPDVVEIALLNGTKWEFAGGAYFPEHIVRKGLENPWELPSDGIAEDETYTANESTADGLTYVRRSWTAVNGMKIGAKVGAVVGGGQFALVSGFVGYIAAVEGLHGLGGGLAIVLNVFSGLSVLPIIAAGGVTGVIAGLLTGWTRRLSWSRKAGVIASEHLWNKLSGWCLNDRFEWCGNDIVVPVGQSCPSLADLDDAGLSQPAAK